MKVERQEIARIILMEDDDGRRDTFDQVMARRPEIWSRSFATVDEVLEKVESTAANTGTPLIDGFLLDVCVPRSKAEIELGKAPQDHDPLGPELALKIAKDPRVSHARIVMHTKFVEKKVVEDALNQLANCENVVACYQVNETTGVMSRIDRTGENTPLDRPLDIPTQICDCLDAIRWAPVRILRETSPAFTVVLDDSEVPPELLDTASFLLNGYPPEENVSYNELNMRGRSVTFDATALFPRDYNYLMVEVSLDGERKKSIFSVGNRP